MGRYLEIFRRTPAPREKSEISEITCPQPSAGCEKSELSQITHSHNEQQNDFSRLIRFFRELERRCPLHINPADWQQALDDGRKFLASWCEQADALGWTPADLFGLHTPPEKPAPNYRRLSRYDQTGLIWLLRGRRVVELTKDKAVIETATRTVSYRRYNKPALGPLGDSLDDFAPRSRAHFGSVV